MFTSQWAYAMPLLVTSQAAIIALQRDRVRRPAARMRCFLKSEVFVMYVANSCVVALCRSSTTSVCLHVCLCVVVCLTVAVLTGVSRSTWVPGRLCTRRVAVWLQTVSQQRHVRWLRVILRVPLYTAVLRTTLPVRSVTHSTACQISTYKLYFHCYNDSINHAACCCYESASMLVQHNTEPMVSGLLTSPRARVERVVTRQI